MHKLQRQVASHKTFAFHGSELLQTVTARPWLSRDQCNRAPTNGLWASLPNPPCKLTLCDNLASPLSQLLTDFLGARRELWGCGDWWDFVQAACQAPSQCAELQAGTKWPNGDSWGFGAAITAFIPPSIHLPQGRGPSFPLLMSPQQFVSLEQVLAITAVQFQGLGNSTPRLLIW